MKTMNKRQAKKAFKKKYGYNPGEVFKKLPELLDEMAKHFRTIIKQINEEAIEEYLQQAERNRNNTAAAVTELKEGEE